jgi:biopolymer transport protein ExbD
MTQDFDLSTVEIIVDTNGLVEMVGTKLSTPQFGHMIAKLVADLAEAGRSPPPIHMGIDARTPFDKVWPVLLTCCSSGMWKVGFAVSDGDENRVNVLRVWLPVMASNSPYQSPLTMKPDAEFMTIGVQTNGFLVGRLTNGVVTWQQNLKEESFVRYVQSLGERDRTTTIIIVPLQGVNHGQVANAIYRCWRFHLENTGLAREDALRTVGSDEKQTAPPP